MSVYLVDGNFVCPSCGSKSKLSRIPSDPGVYKITCYKCKQQVLHKVGNPVVEIKESEIKSPEIIEKPVSLKTPLSEERSEEKIDKPILQNKITFEDSHKSKKEFEEIDISDKDPIEKNKAIQMPFLEVKKVGSKVPKPVPPEFQKKESSFWQYIPPIFRNKLLLFSIFFILVGGMFLGVPLIANYKESQLELVDLLQELIKNKPSRILDRNGVMVSEIYQKKTGSTKFHAFPPKLIEIILAVEDKDFYSHSGIDYYALVRAMYKNVVSLKYTQGASTISQQLARILIKDRRKSISRKYREALIALALESRLSKEDILQAYMNQVYLGHGAFGFENAAHYYFEKKMDDLTVPEMIVLSSLASNPNTYSPFKNLNASKRRVRILTKTLIKNGIVSSEYDGKMESFLESLKQPNYNTVFGARYDSAPYVTEHIREVLKTLDPNIYEVGGYTVETTLVKEAQDFVPDLIKKHLAELKERKRVRKVKVKEGGKFTADQIELQAAVIGLDPKTGEVMFMHGGGEDFHANNQFNRAVQMKRQTGSAIKPILYSAGVDLGLIFPSTKMLDAPLQFRNSKGNVFWSPDNFGQVYEGEISIRDALAKSKNTIAVQIGEQLGIGNLEKYYSKYFFPEQNEKNKRFRYDLSISLGSLEISPLEMASAFSNFANDGIIRRPYLIKKITNSKGKVVYQSFDGDEFNLKVPEERRVIQPDTAEVMVSIMKGSANASGVKSVGNIGEVIGKTGTTNDYIDAWFVGTKPRISMAVWIGYDEAAYGMGPGGMGASLAAPLWGKITKRLLAENIISEEKFQFSKKATWATICRESGHLAGEMCTETGSEIFPKDRRPPVCKISHGYLEKDVLKNLFP